MEITPEMRRLADELEKKLVDEGKLVEGGWEGFKLLVIPKNAPDVQFREMRLAFFAGAQHLFGSIMSILDPTREDGEPTEADMQRMTNIHNELQEFAKTFQLRYGPTSGRA